MIKKFLIRLRDTKLMLWILFSYYFLYLIFPQGNSYYSILYAILAITSFILVERKFLKERKVRKYLKIQNLSALEMQLVIDSLYQGNVNNIKDEEEFYNIMIADKKYIKKILKLVKLKASITVDVYTEL